MFIHKNPQFDISPGICHINQHFGHYYLMIDRLESYLTELQQSKVSPSIFTTKRLFYMKTCSFSLSSYLIQKVQNFPFTAEEMLCHVGNKYINIINLHCYTMGSWSTELTSCVSCLTSFVFGCFW